MKNLPVIQANCSFSEDEGEIRDGMKYLYIGLEMLHGTTGWEDRDCIWTVTCLGRLKGSSVHWLPTHPGDKAVMWSMEAERDPGFCLRHNQILWKYIVDACEKWKCSSLSRVWLLATQRLWPAGSSVHGLSQASILEWLPCPQRPPKNAGSLSLALAWEPALLISAQGCSKQVDSG